MRITVYIGTGPGIILNALSSTNAEGGSNVYISVSNSTGVTGTYCIYTLFDLVVVSDIISIPNTSYRATWRTTRGFTEDFAFGSR